MAVWKKVLVSASRADVTALKVDNLTNGYVVIGGGQSGDLTARAVSGSGAILANGGSGIQLTGSFSGSFTGNLTGTSSWATNATTATQVANSLTQGTGINTFTYNGSSAQTVSVAGASTLNTNAVTKWNGTAFANSSIFDDGTNVTGSTSLRFTGANTSLTGSFTGSFAGNLTGTSSFATNALTASFVTGSIFSAGNLALSASYAVTAAFALNVAVLSNLTSGEGISTFTYNGSSPASIAISGAADLTGGRLIKWDDTANKVANSLIFDDGTNVQITGSTVTISGSSAALIVTGSVRASAGFTGSLLGTSSWAANATNALTASFIGNLNQNLVITGSVIISGSANPELIVIGDAQITGSVNSKGGFTGSLLGTASWANNATQVANSLTAGNGLTGTSFNGSAASTFDVGAGALITVNPDVVMVSTSSLAENQIVKFSNNTLSGSNISDNGNTVTISRPTNITQGGITVTGNSTFNNNVNIAGDLTVAGTASFQNTQNLLIGDRFIALASGSTTLTEGGIIVVSSTGANGMSGSAWYLEAGNGTDHGTYGRWATSFNVHASASAATVSEYAVTVNVAANTNPSAAPVWGGSVNGSGNMWINDNTGDIFIYA